jgi:hypothetical protein
VAKEKVRQAGRNALEKWKKDNPVTFNVNYNSVLDMINKY